MIALLLIVAAVAAVLLVAAALRPSEFSVARSAVILAPAAVVFPHVNDLRLWQAWSPWSKLDPQAKNTFDGPPAGTGASVAWVGNGQVGAGRMTITESRPDESVRLRLDFLKPFQATNAAEFAFAPAEGGTLVTWSMSGRSGFVAKVVGLFLNCQKMVGSQFDKGLADLKMISEAGAGR